MTDTSDSRSRRTILAGALGGLAGLALGALGRPAETRAANGETVTVGGSFSGTATTQLTVSTMQPAIAGYSTATTGTSDGVRGEGYAPNGIGVYGIARADSGPSTGVRGDTFSPSGTGVYGGGGSVGVSGYSSQAYGKGVDGYAYSSTSGRPIGVSGGSGHASGIGVFGQNTPGGPGVVGQSGSDVFTPPAKTGVYGHSTKDASSRGVHGRSSAGRGVYGQAGTGSGVYGSATSGVGVLATATSGTALQADGQVRFSTAGRGTIASGTKSKTVDPGVPLTSSSKILVTLMGHPGGVTVVQRVSVNTTADTFIVYLTANATASTAFAYFVIS